MSRFNRFVGLVVCSISVASSLALLDGCAFDVMSLKQVPTKLESGASPRSSFRLAREATVSPSGGFRRTLRESTNWIYVGTISQGDVFKTSDQVLTVEA